MRGALIFVTGPSGSGKDTLIRAALAARPDILPARRRITRPADTATEDFEPVTEAAFAELKKTGAFALDWEAHGLSYGVPREIEKPLAAGRHVLANGSRAAIEAARARFSPLLILLVTAPAEVLAARLAARGRESAEAIAERLARAALDAPTGADVIAVCNGGALEDGIAAFLSALPAPSGESG
ncbi:MAG: phosphonate metabolism protein/1,5-bisphosphokinase (PRPP-forming) PhnN [Pikeienuella sp.]